MNRTSAWKGARILLTTFYLFLGWILFSGNFDPTSLFAGLFFSFSIALITYNLFIEKEEVERRSLIPKVHIIALYLLYLITRMYLNSFRVLYNIMRGNINPRVVYFRTKLKSDMARVILANSITLTPGTITLVIDKDHLVVHWLEAKTTHSHYSGELIKDTMEKLLKRAFV